MPLDAISAQMILLECSGDDIWDEQKCRAAGVPQAWIDELIDNFESGYDSDRNTIYENEKMVNQYRGVQDLQLAYKLAEYLGLDWRRITASTLGRRAEVAALKEALDEL